MLRLDDYPQLAFIAWSRKCREISEEDAFALYEANWRFVEIDKMIPAEKALLERLTHEQGHGVLNV